MRVISGSELEAVTGGAGNPVPPRPPSPFPTPLKTVPGTTVSRGTNPFGPGPKPPGTITFYVKWT